MLIVPIIGTVLLVTLMIDELEYSYFLVKLENWLKFTSLELRI